MSRISPPPDIVPSTDTDFVAALAPVVDAIAVAKLATYAAVPVAAAPPRVAIYAATAAGAQATAIAAAAADVDVTVAASSVFSSVHATIF